MYFFYVMCTCKFSPSFQDFKVFRSFLQKESFSATFLYVGFASICSAESMGIRATEPFFEGNGKKHGAFSFKNEVTIQNVASSYCGWTRIPYQFSEVVRGSISGV